MNNENVPAADTDGVSQKAPAKRATRKKVTAKQVSSADAVDAPAKAAPVEVAPAKADAGAEEVPVATAAEKPAPKRRVGRPRKTTASQAQTQDEAVATASSGDAPAAEKPAKRRGRPRKVTTDAPAASVTGEESPEIMQARALAQISQASVVRRQRRAAERAAEMLTADIDTPTPAADNLSAVDPSLADAVKPLVDPALRPNRRGRKPKAYVEAEKAAAAALAAQQAALMEARDQALAESARAASNPEGSVSPSEELVKQASDMEGPSDQDAKKDVRPGRSNRGKKRDSRAKDSEGVTDAAPQAESSAEAPAPAGDAARSDAKPPRRSHKDRSDAERPSKGDKSDRPAADRDRAAERRERRERQKENRKQRNNRYAPTEPTLTREELSAMKVAELREKARELGLDPAGIKKPELIEAVYAAAARAEGFRDIEGILDMDNQGFGYIRAHGYMPSRDDAFVSAQMIRAAGLRPGDYISGSLRPMRANDKLPGLAKLYSVNGVEPDKIKGRPKFADLTPIYPNEPLKMEHGRDSITGRAIDIVSPIGKGQRGLIVSPPKAGKTTILKKICQSIAINNPEVHLICLLVDERPEEVTDMQRSIKGDVVASTFDMPADNHTRVSELVIERAKRIVELGGDVVVVLDSITRLARAYNLAAPASGRILSGGVDSAALYPPKRFLGAARNIENGGSLTILASALVDTGSKMDEVIFEEFKGTGNMELKLDRDLADRRIFPAIDPIASGTRNEDLLVDEQMRPFVWGIRRILAGMNNTERAAASFIKGLKGTNSNQDFLIRTAKKAADHPDAL